MGRAQMARKTGLQTSMRSGPWSSSAGLIACAVCILAASGCVAPLDRQGTDAAQSQEKPAYTAKSADGAKASAALLSPLPQGVPNARTPAPSDTLVKTSHEELAKNPAPDQALDLPDPLPLPERDEASSNGSTEKDKTKTQGKEKAKQDQSKGQAEKLPDNSRSELTPSIPAAAQEYPIDLTTSLRLAEVENPQIAEARQRIGEALAVLQGAKVLLLPSLNLGMNYHAHTGNLQRSSGTILKLDEKSLYFGGGAGAMAAGTVEVPAISIFSSLTDAYFKPLAAHQQVEGARFQASAMANKVLLEVVELHFELLAAEADLRVRLETAAQGADVARLTHAYAIAGQGRDADAERAATELRLVELEVKQAEQEVAVASARLAHRLHLDQSVRIRPAAPRLEMITLIDPGTPLPNLIAVAVERHPEISAKAAALAVAEVRHRQEICRPFLPTVWLGYSAGGFGGGSNLVGTELSHFAGRTDFDVQVFWTLSNMGFGNLALIKQRQAEVGAADGERAHAIAEVRSVVAAAYAEVAAARRQIDVTTQQLASAERGFREDIERIRNTVGRPIEVVNSLQLLNQARVDRIRAIIEYNKAEFRLFVALGTPPPLGAPADTPLPPAPIASPLLPPLAHVNPASRRPLEPVSLRLPGDAAPAVIQGDVSTIVWAFVAQPSLPSEALRQVEATAKCDQLVSPFGPPSHGRKLARQLATGPCSDNTPCPMVFEISEAYL